MPLFSFYEIRRHRFSLLVVTFLLGLVLTKTGFWESASLSLGLPENPYKVSADSLKNQAARAEILAIPIKHQACIGDLCLMPGTTGFGITIEVAAPLASKSREGQDIFSKGYLYMLAAMFAAGLAASLTPCIWPMIPVTVGILGSLSGGGRFKGFLYSLLYVLGISITYSLMGIIAARSGAAFGEFSNHPAVLGVVAVVFLIFGLSMFDLFDIQLSGEFTAKLQRRRHGVPGVLIMGLLAGLVASPCIAPLVASLLAIVAKTGDILLGALGLGAFAWGMGILFIILGTFTGAMSYLPRSGMWMVEVKHLFGLIMVFCSIYFISPVLGKTVTAGTAGLTLILLAAAGAPLSALREEAALSTRFRGGICVAMLAVGVTLLGCLTGEIAGIGLSKVSLSGVGIPATGAAATAKYNADQWRHEIDTALESARSEKRPVIIDFYAEWCAQCKKLDQEVFSSPAFIEAAENFVKIKVDMTEREGSDPAKLAALREKYNVFGYPRVVFLDNTGTMNGELSFDGFMTLDQVLQKMRKAK